MERDKPAVAVVIPCYRVEPFIEAVIRSLPGWVQYIIAVNDASPDGTQAVLEKLAATDPRLRVMRHEKNGGVGRAMTTGFSEALKLEADIVVKMDGDGQMDVSYLPHLLVPLLDGRADYAKGNRFRHTKALVNMPKRRLVGNIGLTFLSKLATGYWHVFDVQNGYLAIRREALAQIPLEKLDAGYTFENSMLALLNIEDTPVADVPMPARYGDEVSSMSLFRVFFAFPPRLLKMLVRRIGLKYLIYDVSPISIYAILSVLFMSFSLVFGGYHWWLSYSSAVPASTGTVVLALLPFLMAFELLLQAVQLDIQRSPRPRPSERSILPEEIPTLLAGAAAEAPVSVQVFSKA